jgi:hypothetical protein
MPAIRVYYQTVGNMDEDGSYDEECGEEGEIDCTPDEFDIEDGLTAVDLAVKALIDRGATIGSSSWYTYGFWYNTTGEKLNYRTGESTTYSFHLEGFSEQEEIQIFLDWRSKVSWRRVHE